MQKIERVNDSWKELARDPWNYILYSDEHDNQYLMVMLNVSAAYWQEVYLLSGQEQALIQQNPENVEPLISQIRKEVFGGN